MNVNIENRIKFNQIYLPHYCILTLDMKGAFSIILFLGLIFASTSLSHHQSTTGTTTIQDGWGVSEAESNFQNITNLNAPNWILGQQTFDNYTNEIFKFVTANNATKCPIETPFVRGSDSKCINCAGDKPIFDLFSKDCVACPAGQQHNPLTHTCEAGSAKCGANYIWNEAQQICVCPADFPVDLGCECVTCLEPFVWNANERSCKLRCEESHFWNKDKQICECPKSTYEVSGECVFCIAPFEWRAEFNTCQLKVNSCGAAPVAPVAPVTPVVSTCSSNYVWDNKVQKCVCPSYLPFNDGTKCVACNLPQYWDHDLKQCLSCPPNKIFNTNTRNCEACPANRPLYRNFECEVCPAYTTYDPISNSCQDNAIDPSTVSKVPVYTPPVDNSMDPSFTPTVSVYTPPEDNSIDPSATPKIPVYSNI